MKNENKPIRSVIELIILILITSCVVSYSVCAKASELLDLNLLYAVQKASVKYKISPNNLLKIAFVESSMRINVKPRYNKNGTQDIGPFQINTIHWNTTCSDYNLESVEGNALCAAKLIRIHKKKRSVDALWLARYHSKTPSLKRIYYKKLQKAEKYLKSKKVFKFYANYTDVIHRQLSEF